MEGAEEKGKFGEQTVNKFIEMVLARLVNAERLQVRVKANLKRLVRGEVDALAIEMFGFLLQRNLRVAEFQLNIGSAAVNVRSVMRRQIELVRPSEGSLRMVITQEQLTDVLNAELVNSLDEEQNKLQQVNCEFRSDGAIAFHFNWICKEEIQSGNCITRGRITSDGNAVVLDRQDVKQKEPPAEYVNLAIARVNYILSLGDVANRGSTFYIQQLDIESNKLIVQATARIEQFPSA